MDLEKYPKCYSKISGKSTYFFFHVSFLFRFKTGLWFSIFSRWSFLARVRFWFVVAILESRTCAKNMGHAERDQQIAKRTIYSSKTKWAKSKGEPESLFPSPSILFSRETKRNETNSLDDWQKTKCVVIPRRFTVGHSSLVLTLSLSLFFFFFLFFNRSTFAPPRSFPRAQSKDSR